MNTQTFNQYGNINGAHCFYFNAPRCALSLDPIVKKEDIFFSQDQNGDWYALLDYSQPSVYVGCRNTLVKDVALAFLRTHAVDFQKSDFMKEFFWDSAKRKAFPDRTSKAQTHFRLVKDYGNGLFDWQVLDQDGHGSFQTNSTIPYIVAFHLHQVAA